MANDRRKQPVSFLKQPGRWFIQNTGIDHHENRVFWFLFIFSIALGAGVSYGVLGPVYFIKSFESQLPPGYGSGIYLQGVVNQLNLDNDFLGIQWLVYSCEETGPYAGCNPLLDATNFFVDANAAPASGFYSGTANLVYKANLTGYITDGFCIGETDCWDQQESLGVPYEQSISTTHQFSVKAGAYNWRSNSQAYPFDFYTVYTTFLAVDPTANVSRNIIGVSMTGTVPNYGIQMSSRPVSNPTYPNLEWRAITITITRAPIVVAYAFLIWIINWLTTGIVMWVTVSAVLGGRQIPSDLFAVPISALFALPTVRGIMPGAPFFGCILDYSGIILNLVVTTICSIALLLYVIANPEGSRDDESDRDVRPSTRGKSMDDGAIATLNKDIDEKV